VLVRAAAFVFPVLAALAACAPDGRNGAAKASIAPDAGAVPARQTRAPRLTVPRPTPTVLEIPADLPDPFEDPPKASSVPAKPKGIQL
jgi:hypothetical protein